MKGFSACQRGQVQILKEKFWVSHKVDGFYARASKPPLQQTSLKSWAAKVALSLLVISNGNKASKAVRIKGVQRLKPSNTNWPTEGSWSNEWPPHHLFPFPSKEKKMLGLRPSRVGVRKHQFNTKADICGLITTNSFIYFPFSLMKINS